MFWLYVGPNVCVWQCSDWLAGLVPDAEYFGLLDVEERGFNLWLVKLLWGGKPSTVDVWVQLLKLSTKKETQDRHPASSWITSLYVVTCFSFLRLCFSFKFWSVRSISSSSSMAFWEDASFCCSNSVLLIWWQKVWMETGAKAESPPSWSPSLLTGIWWGESVNPWMHCHGLTVTAPQAPGCRILTCTVRRYCMWSFIALSRYSGTERICSWWSSRKETSLVASSSSRSHSTALPRMQPENVCTIWGGARKQIRKTRHTFGAPSHVLVNYFAFHLWSQASPVFSCQWQGGDGACPHSGWCDTSSSWAAATSCESWGVGGGCISAGLQWPHAQTEAGDLQTHTQWG